MLVLSTNLSLEKNNKTCQNYVSMNDELFVKEILKEEMEGVEKDLSLNYYPLSMNNLLKGFK